MNGPAKFIIYPVVGLLSVLLFVYLTLPTDKIQLLTEGYFELFLGGKYHVKSEEFEVSLLDGVEMRTISLEPYFLKDDGTYPGDGYIDAVRVDASLTDYLFDDALNATFEMEAAGGLISGSIEQSPEAMALAAEIDGVLLQRFILLRHAMDLPLGGLLGGTVNLEFGEGMNLSGGDTAITLRGGTVGPAPLPELAPGFTLPKTRLGALSLGLDISPSKRITFKKVSGEGEDVEITVTGWWQLKSPRSPREQYDITIRARFDETYVEENALGPVLRSTCKIFPDGFIQLHYRGMEGQAKPRCVPPSGARRPPRATRATPPPNRPAPRRTAAAPEPEVDTVAQEEPVSPPVRRSPPPKRRAPIRSNSNVLRPGVRPASADQLPSHIKPVAPQRRQQILDSAYPKQR